MLLWRCLLRNMPNNVDNAVAMRRILWALIFAVATATAMWMVVGNKWNLQDNPVASRIVFGYFLFICAGPYWMLYDSWRHERKLTGKMWLVFVPAGFLWYYFEVFRPRERSKRGKILRAG